MAEDIVSALREFAGADPDAWQAREAAAEIERLRAAGDALSARMTLLVNEHMLLKNVLDGEPRIAADHLRVVMVWEKARRG